LSKYEWSRRRPFYEKHVKDGRPDDTMIFNQVIPIVLVGVAVALAIRLWAVKDKKLLAGESELVISDKERISYDSIQKIDKTHFDSKGFFTITYRRGGGTESSCRLSNKKYDNLPAILDELVARIS